jgi:hypothetical protein
MSRARRIAGLLAGLLAALCLAGCGAAPTTTENPTGGLPPAPAGYAVVAPELPRPTSPEAAAATKARGDAAFLAGTMVYRGATAGLVIGELVDGGARYEERSVVYVRDAASDVVVKDERWAFVAAGPQGITVVDVSEPRKPRAVALIETPGAAVRLSLRGDLLLVADGSMGAAIIDVRDPRTPRPIAAWRSKGYVKHAVFGDAGAIFVAEGTAGVARLAFDGEALSEVWRLDTEGEARAICLRGGSLYVADGAAGIAAIDVSGAAPAEVGRLALADMARDVAVTADGRWAFVASGDDGVVMIDLAKADGPASAGAFPLEKPVNRVLLDGDRLVLGNDSAGLAILDVAEPAKPVQLFPKKD